MPNLCLSIAIVGLLALAGTEAAKKEKELEEGMARPILKGEYATAFYLDSLCILSTQARRRISPSYMR